MPESPQYKRTKLKLAFVGITAGMGVVSSIAPYPYNFIATISLILPLYVTINKLVSNNYHQ